MRAAPILLACLVLAACGTSKTEQAPQPAGSGADVLITADWRSEEHTSELQSH